MQGVLSWGVLAVGKENHCLHVPTAFVLVQMSGTCPRKTAAAAQLSSQPVPVPALPLLHPSSSFSEGTTLAPASVLL